MTLKPIRVTYRAVFKSPIGPLNPMGLNFPVAMTIEIYESRPGVWKARECDTGKKRPIEQVSGAGTLQNAQNAVKDLFRECLLPWQMWGDPGFYDTDPPGVRLIQPSEVEVTANKVFFKMPEPAK